MRAGWRRVPKGEFPVLSEQVGDKRETTIFTEWTERYISYLQGWLSSSHVTAVTGAHLQFPLRASHYTFPLHKYHYKMNCP